MKITIYVLLFFFGQIGFSQTDADFENSIKTIIESMKADSADKIFDMFSADLQKELTIDKLKEMMASTLKEFGKPLEHDFMMDDSGLKRYLIQTEKDSFMIDIALSKDLKITQLKLE